MAENKHELSSGTMRSWRHPASRPGSWTDSDGSSGISPAGSGDSVTASGARGSLGGRGAESSASSSLTDGRRWRLGDREVEGTAMTISCSPRLMGIEARRPAVSGRGLGG